MGVRAGLCQKDKKSRWMEHTLGCCDIPIHWGSHIPNQQLYGELQAVSNKMASPRLELEGHCYRHPEFSPLRAHTWSSREEDRKLPILTLLLH